jgi:opacity protein-like surface antigen
MKKILMIFLTALLACTITTVAAAAEQSANVYLDYIVGGLDTIKGTGMDENVELKHDNSGFVIGGEYFMQDWKFGLEYGNGQMKEKTSSKKTDFDFYDLRLGYKILKKNNWDLYLSSSVLTSNYEYYENFGTDEWCPKFQTYAVVVGPEFYYQLNDKFTVNGFAGYSVVASTTSNIAYLDDDGKIKEINSWGMYDETTSIIRLQLNYLLTDQVTLDLGYRTHQSSAKVIEGAKYSNTFDLITLGIAYRF